MNWKAVWMGAALLAAAPAAYALDAQDQGEYVLLNTQEQPTPMQMRFFLSGEQWMMDGREGQGEWRPVCRGTGECRLVPSTGREVARLKAVLPAQWQPHQFSCIENKALAFCRVQDAAQPNRRAYWWFALVDNQVRALPLNRLR